jgi:hypothetical protein
VLFESKKDNGYIEGYTTNYIRVKVKAGEAVENSISDVILTRNELNALPSLLKGVVPLEGEIIKRETEIIS